MAGEQSAEKIERSIRKNEQKKKNLMKKMACGQAFDRRNACAWTNNSRISLAGALSMQIVWKQLSCCVFLQVDAFRILPQPKGIAMSMQSSEVFPPKDKPPTLDFVCMYHNKF